jgi:hypothetical protein
MAEVKGGRGGSTSGETLAVLIPGPASSRSPGRPHKRPLTSPATIGRPALSRCFRLPLCSAMAPSRTIKLVIIGDSGVGKTSLRGQVRPLFACLRQ